MPRDQKAQRAARMRWYVKNKAKQLERQFERRREMRDLVRSFKESCCRCGFSDPRALVFHHRDPAEKSAEIRALVQNGASKARVLAELEKCDVLCANCHAIEHYAE